MVRFLNNGRIQTLILGGVARGWTKKVALFLSFSPFSDENREQDKTGPNSTKNSCDTDFSQKNFLLFSH